MSYNPISYLGLSCPSGGHFYICQESKVGFIGCCDVDPCSSDCPLSALHPASFNADKYSAIPKQNCVESTSPALWYTCANTRPTFLGCCVSNPCNNGGVCQNGDLVGARLADDPSSASVFLTATTAATVTSATSTSTSTSRSTLAPASTTITIVQRPSPTSTTASKESPPAPTSGIVGGILGGLIVLLLVAFVFFQYRKRRRRRETALAQPDGDALHPPWSPYHDSLRRSPKMPSAPVSPLSMASTRHRSLSASLSSIIGFKRGSTAKRESVGASDWVAGTHESRQASPGFLGSVAELESLPPGGLMFRGPLRNTIHYEVEGSAARVEPM